MLSKTGDQSATKTFCIAFAIYITDKFTTLLDFSTAVLVSPQKLEALP